MSRDPRRSLPSVSQLAAALTGARPEVPAWAATQAARRVVAEARDELAARVAELANDEVPGAVAPVDWVGRAGVVAEHLARAHPRRVVNATGVVLHTNLGRSPLAAGAADAARRAAAHYSDLELDLDTGRRGSRHGVLAEKLCELTGAEAAYACNNNAAAVMLGLDTLARGREVVVSRGELVEIGGSFRVPDIMERAGVRLVEVGTTNRTHARDYERAIGPQTGLLLKVHRSNFSQAGFIKEVRLDELVAIGRAHGVATMEDLGSGTLIDLTRRGFPAESFVPSRLGTGADLVCFSGDKLLGGPQAGLLLGTAPLMARVLENPLARALRLDKMSLAALDWTLDAYLEGRAETDVPVLRQLLAPASVLEARARALAGELSERLLRKRPGKLADAAGPRIGVEPDRAPVGGGSLPGFELDTFVVVVRAPETPRPRGSTGAGSTHAAEGTAAWSATRTAGALRRAPVPVLARVREGAVIFDVRTVAEDELTLVAEALEGVAR